MYQWINIEYQGLFSIKRKNYLEIIFFCCCKKTKGTLIFLFGLNTIFLFELRISSQSSASLQLHDEPSGSVGRVLDLRSKGC